MLETILAAASCANVAVPAATETAMRYYYSGNVLWILNQLWGFIVPLLFLVTGFSGKLGSFSKLWGRNWYFTIVVYLVLFLGITSVLNFPLDYYGDFVREHTYGLSMQSFSRWLSSYGKDLLVTIVIAAAFVWIFYLLLKKSPQRWWFYGGLVSMGISFIMMFVQPIWIDPLFNTFGPMKDKKMEKEILRLASVAGIDHGRVFEADMSKDTNVINAYVVGFGSTNRIVLWDTALEQMTPDEILFVMGHEMGHYVLHHIWWGILFYSALSFAIFYLTYLSANYLLKKYRGMFGFKHLYDIASLPLMVFLISAFTFLSLPISNAFSRHLEHEADRFGLEITQDNDAAANAFLVLQQKNLGNPRPGGLYTMWRGTHPSLGDRIDFCNSYCPWNENRPEKYGKYFKNE